MKTALSLVNYHLESRRSAPGLYALSCAFIKWKKVINDSGIKEFKPRLRHIIQIFSRQITARAFLRWKGPQKIVEKSDKMGFINHSV